MAEIDVSQVIFDEPVTQTDDLVEPAQNNLDVSQVVFDDPQTEKIFDSNRGKAFEIPAGVTGREADFLIGTQHEQRAKSDYFGLVDLGRDSLKGLIATLIQIPFVSGPILKQKGRLGKGEVSGLGLVPTTESIMQDVQTAIFGRTSESLGPVSKGMVQFGDYINTKRKELIDAVGLKEDPNLPKGPLGISAFQAGEAAGSLALFLGLLVWSKDTKLSASVAAALQKSSLSEEADSAGVNPLIGSVASDIGATIEGAIEMVGGATFLKAIGFNHVVKRTISAIGTEAAQEAAQQFGEEVVTHVSGMRTDTFEDAIQRIGQAAILGAVLSAGPGVALHISQKNGVHKVFTDAGFTPEQADTLIQKTSEKTIESGEVQQEMIRLVEQELSAISMTTDERVKALEQIQTELAKLQPEPKKKETAPDLQKTEEQAQKLVKQGRVQLLTEQADLTLKQIDQLEREQALREEQGKPTKALEDKLNALVAHYDSIDSQIAELQIDETVEPAAEDIIQTQSQKVLGLLETAKKETEQVRQRSIKEGEAGMKAQIEGVQKTVTDLIDQSSLDPKDKAKFLKSVRNVQTLTQLDKILPDLEQRIATLENRSESIKLIERIKNLLTSTRPRLQSGKPVGQFTPGIQRVLDKARAISKLNEVEALFRREELLKEYEKLEDQGKLPSPEQALEMRLLSIFSGLENRNVEALREALAEISGLVELGRGRSKLKQALLAQRKESLIDAAKQLIQGVRPVKATDKRSDRPFTITVGKSLSGFTDLIDMLVQDNPSIAQGEDLLTAALDPTLNEQAEKFQVQTAIKNLMKAFLDIYGFKEEQEGMRQLDRDSKRVDMGLFRDASGQQVRLEISKAEALTVWLLMQDATISDNLTSERGGIVIENRVIKGLTPQMMDVINQMLTQQDVAFGRALLKAYKTSYTRVNPVYQRLMGLDLIDLPNYSPTERQVTKELPTDSFLKEQNFRRTSFPGATKARVRNFHPLVIKPAPAVYTRHILEMEHFINWADKLRDMNAVFGDTGIRNLIESKFGTGLMKEIDHQIQKFTSGGRNNAETFDWVDRLRTNFTVSVLALKPALAVKQLTGFLAFAEFVPTKDFITGVFDFLSSPIENFKILAATPFMQTRGQSMTRDIADIYKSKEALLFHKDPSFVNAMLLAVKIGDQGAIALGGWAVYKHALKQGLSHEEAIAKFEKAAISTQQSSDLSQLSRWQNGNSVQKLFTMFTSAQNQYFRREMGAIRNLIKGRLPVKDFAKKMAIYHFLIPMFFQWVSDLGRWDGEEQKRAALLGSLNGIFILGDLLDFITRAGLYAAGGDIRVFDVSTPVMRIGDGIRKAFNDLKDSDFDVEDVATAIKDLSEGTLGPISGLPIKQVLNWFEAAYDFAEGEPGKAVVKTLGWPDSVIQKSFD